MAYYNSNSGAPQNSSLGMNQKKEEDQAALGTAPVSAAPVALTTASANGANAAQGPYTGAPIAQNAAPKANASGMSGGFQSYQKANQGTATNRLADAANRNVAAQGQAAQTGINQATDQFGKKVDAGSLANRYQALQDVSNTLNSARTLSAPAPQAAAPVSTANAASPAPIAPTAAPAPDYTKNVAGADRFKEVINAKYQGPESLRQSGLYQDAAAKANAAQTTLNQTKTASGREQMLQDMYVKRGDYTRGLNKLDSAVLNSSQSGVQNLQDTAKAQGNLQGNLDKAQLASGAMAQNRGQEIQGIRNQARDVFSQNKQQEEKATDDRLATQVKDWDKLPEYFRNVLREQSKGGVGLNSAEAGILGIQNGEGLYNTGADVIKSGVADKQKLITRDEQARQSALAQLAGLDDSKMLDTNLKYNDASKAGTQTSLDALDLAGTRAGLNQAEQGFQDYAKSADLTGSGSKKNKTSGKRYYADANANVADVLKNAGYNFDKSAAANSIGNQDILKNLASATQRTGDEDKFTGLDNGYMAPYSDNRNAAQTGSQALLDYSSGGVLPGMRALGINTDFADTSKWFGGGANSAQSKDVAKKQAYKDLEDKITGALDQSGFNNRFQVQDNAQTTSRMSALQNLLENLDKSNQGKT